MSEFFESLSTKFGQAFSYADEQPIRAEIFSVERLEQYAKALAAQHKTVTKKGRAQLLPRLEDNGRKLFAAYRILVQAIKNGRPMSPAAEWLIDNFHIVEEQLREIREDLPKSYYHELPKLSEGELKDYPRIYAVALELIAHTDCRLDTETLRRFIVAYQTIAPLTIGELWAVAITLRLALVENLRRLTTVIVSARDEREQADKLADKFLELASRQQSALAALITERLGKRDKLPPSFVVQLTQRLREQDPAVMPVLDSLEKQLARQGTTIEQVIHAEHQRQAATQVTVGNIITSMRLLSTLDWRDFFESVSLIEPLLGQDPAGAYSRMEFKSRDRYRHVIERISKRTRANELEIARAAVDLAAGAVRGTDKNGILSPATHVGFYLVDDGLDLLEAAFGYQPRLAEKLRRFVLSHAPAAYLGMLVILTALIVGVLLHFMNVAGAGWPMLILTSLLALIPASDLAVSVLNWDVTHLFPPRLLPRMETAEGVPEEARTMVVVPTIFSSEEQVYELVEKLEVQFLANQDQHIFFGLLGDFADADAETMPGDDSVLAAARQGINEINRRHSKNGLPRFHLFHRRRVWNSSEDKWMGWERKRGKLEEFNHLVRGQADTTFMVCTADDALLRKVRYVITLDTDTQLPRDAARKLVGAATHPLNRPQIDPAVKRVTKGYGILQPRVSISLESASRTIFARIFSGNTGIDPYTTAVSDVYQDLFGEGSFTGKGLYEVEAFETCLADRVPENSLLSHDLFESLFARAALVTDIELLDEYPEAYDTYAKRQHRWTRGDWQILHWVFPTIPDAQRRKTPNPLPLISRWKISDNLRRSLLAPVLFLWFVAAWTVFPGSPLFWSLFALITIAFPVYLHVTTSLLIHPRGVPWTSHFWSVWTDFRTNSAQFALSIVFLPHQAWVMADAIVSTTYRKLISRKKLLEWVTAADAERSARRNFGAFVWFMLPAELMVAATVVLTSFVRPAAWRVMATLAVVWGISPAVAYWISTWRPPERKLLSTVEVRFARMIARRTWRFFETFVGPEDNWLPPDNFQEDPVPLVAHRTSPTNIGLLSLATLCAHDLGYVGTLEFVERQELTFFTLGKLGKFHGHYFNWYDTRTLQPLNPQYVSTVDSGNLAGHLMAMRQACIDFPDTSLFDDRVIQGLTDTIAAIADEAEKLGSFRQRTDVVTVSQLRNEIEACQLLISTHAGETLESWHLLFKSLGRRVSELEDIISALSHEHGEVNFKELRWWVGALQHQTESARRDAETLVPWVRLLSTVEVRQDPNDAEGGNPWQPLLSLLNRIPQIGELPEVCDSALVQLAALRTEFTSESDQGLNQLTA
ncbi:MAG: cyclic beta 1-2 glucan synthetase, partial [Acidobacteriota bacterium]|nr:cyclic beta 1-2 glucan synthetase [Acidobacteriota bacterium]